MNARDRITDIGQRVIDLAKADMERLPAFLEGPPPNARELNDAEHVAWMAKVVAAKFREYPPQMYMTPDGPVFNSIWLLTRPFVKGWDVEVRRYRRELGHMTEEVSGNGNSRF